MHNGRIETVLPRLKRKLDKLTTFPECKQEQVGNMQAILNFYRSAKQHNLHEQEINSVFIQDYSNKLSEYHKMQLIDLEIRTCGPFIQKIKSYQHQILEFLHTSDPKAVIKTFQLVNRPNDNGISAPGTKQLPGSNSHQAGDRGNDSNQFTSRSHRRHGQGFKPGGRTEMKCRNCTQKHSVYKCYELLNEKDPAKIKLSSRTPQSLC